MARARTLTEFQAAFPDEASCAAFLFERRWPEGFVCPACGVRAAQAELGKRVDRRGLDGKREPELPPDLDRFTAGLRIAWRAGEQRPTHRRPYRRRKPIPRRASMLDDVREQIGAWLAEAPGLPAIAILERVKTLHPDRFTDKHERTVQRAVRRWRAEQAHRIITESATTISGAGVRPAA